MRAIATLLASVCAAGVALPLHAQDTAAQGTPPLDSNQTATPGAQGTMDSPDTTAEAAQADGAAIVVTAQRRAESLQVVPIAVSAFDTAALEAQQIDNASDLQLTLPNVSFTKSNFTSSSFTIRGIGDLCVGVSCDSATAIHTNGSPLFGTRLFETEYFDLERIEVLRGPQGTLFGRNATSGVVNIVSAKPDLSAFRLSAEAEYGNYDSIKAKGMVNIPLGETLGVRLAGYYLNRDGYTRNLFDDSRIDGRDIYAIRGSIRWEPTTDTTVDLMGFYFKENDDRLRIQKQLCQYDPTGVLGCLNTRRDFAKTNTNATITGALTSEEFFRINSIPSALGLNSLYDGGGYRNFTEPRDVRTVNTPFRPEYVADELQVQARLEHDFGGITAQLTGLYQSTSVDSRQDYNLGVTDRSFYARALNTLAVFGANGVPTGLPAPAPAFVPGSAAYFAPIVAALIPQGPAGPICTSDTRLDNRGAFEGFSVCSPAGLQFDRSNQDNDGFSAELILSSDFSGSVNFLLGGIYSKQRVTENSFYVNAFPLDYVAGILGSFSTFATAVDANPANNLPPAYLATSFFRNNTQDFELVSYGLFGEVYLDLTDRLKLTGGLRYNDDAKTITARSTLANFLNPYANDGDPFASPFVGTFDADPGVAGNQLVQQREASFSEITGRAVLDFQVTRDNLIYASYSRGYKSGGINPPLQPIFSVPETFDSEQIDAFEIGSKNVFADGALMLNATAFYYKYRNLQLSRIVARTSVNDTIDANIYGVELESVIRPDPAWLINLNFSYLHSAVAGDQFFSDPRDPGGGDPNAVIVKDISNGANCAVTGAGARAFVGAINGSLGLRAPTAFPADGGIASTGAFSICNVLSAQASGPVGSAFGGIQVLSPGVTKNLRGNELPQAPSVKASAGVQYTADFANGWSLVPRVDVTFTGEQFGSVFNGIVNRIEPFIQANAQIQLNGPDNRWFVRGFVQNIFDNSAVTGLYITDASSGLFTNIFTLDPRRYGVSVGVNF